MRSDTDHPRSSTSGPVGVALRPAPCLGTVEVTALLDVARVCGDGYIGHSQKTLGNDSSDFEAIELLQFYLG